MAFWKFTDDYGVQYPALQSSVLGLLVFSDHTQTGTSFTGTLDVAASGSALATLAQMLNVASIDVTGQVTNANNRLTVGLTSTEATAFRDGIAASIPLLGKQVTAAHMSVQTVVTTQDTADTGPHTDDLDLSVTVAVGSSSVTLTAGVPMNGGLFIVDGTFENVGIGLQDIQFLMGSLSNGDWFPATQLGPYARGGPALSLLGISLAVYVTLSPFTVAVSSVSAGIGITGIDLFSQRLYLNPIGVWVLVDPTGPTVDWAIEGAIVLCNYARPGDYQHPDFAFDFAMDLTEFTISGQLENPDKLTVNTLLQDLLGAGTSVGLDSNLTIDKFDFSAAADKGAGQLTEFSFDVVMSGGFGLFTQLDIEEISISMEYSA